MFEVEFHEEAEGELHQLPAHIRAKMVRLLQRLEANPRSLREPHSKPLGKGMYEIRTMGNDVARGLWVYHTGSKIYVLRIFIKKTARTPLSEIALAWKRLEDF
ncbi:type II toxin-antitoxin system RelE/ParE family toxin [Erwinia sp. P7711]|uniref:type II toxin-antitoxin system RelE/ParE family toxin n=1 Tax=Erwinia sp. P7711 TaxID=3141451 RepID=UPI0031887CB0